MSSRHIAARLRDNPRGINIWAVAPGNVRASLSLRSLDADLGNPIIHLEFSRAALVFVIFHHARRRPDAEAVGINSRLASWG